MFENMRDKVFPSTEEIINSMDRVETAYNNVIKLAKISSNEGILALEFKTSIIKDTRDLSDDLCWMIHLIVDGTESEIVEEFITNRFLANNYKGIEAFIYYLYARGIMYILEGNSPYLIEEFFNSVLPSTLHRQRISGSYFDKECYIYAENNRERLAVIKEEMSDETRKSVDRVKGLMLALTRQEWNYMTDNDVIAGWEWIIPAVDEMHRIMIDAYMNIGQVSGYLRHIHMPKGNEILEACEEFEAKLMDYRYKCNEQNKSKDTGFLLEMLSEDESVIRGLLNDTDDSILAVALKGCDTSLRKNVLKYTDKKRRYEIEDDMEFMGPVRLSDVEDALTDIKSLYLKTKQG